MAKQCKYCLSVIPSKSLTCSHCGAPDMDKIMSEPSPSVLLYNTGAISLQECRERFELKKAEKDKEEKEMSPDGFLRGLGVSVVFAIIAWVIINFIIK